MVASENDSQASDEEGAPAVPKSVEKEEPVAVESTKKKRHTTKVKRERTRRRRRIGTEIEEFRAFSEDSDFAKRAPDLLIRVEREPVEEVEL